MTARRPRPPKQRPPTPDTPGSEWRLFLAVPLPKPVVTLVGDLVRDLGAEAWPVRWVSPDNAHLTLHFLGETAPERAELLRLALPGVVGKHQAFNLRTADLGVFPNQRRPRVLWLGLHGPAHRLQTLQRTLGNTLRAYDFAVEDRDFHPHVTLGRLRSDRSGLSRNLPAAIQQRFAAEAATGRATARAPLPVPVREVLLIRSHLSRTGSQYEPIGRYPLAEPERERP